MAVKKSDGKDSSKKRQLKLKKPQTVRERAEKSSADKKPRRLKQARSSAVKPFKAVARVGRKEYYLPLPDNRAGRLLNKPRKFFPRYFINSWIELRQVVWPNWKTTIKLTFAVFLFAIFFTLLISSVDYGLDKLFKKLILN
ncbi:MAG: preprotein translocase subunit SecE [Patescibacteria group bacterium]